MNYHQLIYFRDLVHEKSFIRVAKKNKKTQPAISQQIKLLETELGESLFTRNKSSVNVTPYGLGILPRVMDIIGNWEKLLQKSNVADVPEKETLRIATIPTIGLYSLSAEIKRFLASFKHQVNLQIEHTDADQVYRKIQNGDADLGLVAYAKSHPHISQQAYRNECMVLVTYPGHHFKHHSRLKKEHLQHQTWISFSKNLPTRAAIDEYFWKLGIEARFSVEDDHIDYLKSAVESELGIAILPESTVIHEIRYKQLLKFDLPKPGIRRPLCVIHNNQAPLNRMACEFLKRIR